MKQDASSAIHTASCPEPEGLASTQTGRLTPEAALGRAERDGGWAPHPGDRWRSAAVRYLIDDRDTGGSSGMNGDAPAKRGRVVTAWHERYAGSAVEELIRRLGELDFLNWTLLFGATLLLTVLPIILL